MKTINEMIQRAFFILTILLCVASVAAADVTIDSPSDHFDSGIGNYSSVFGNGIASSPGQVLEVLGGSLGGSAALHSKDSESGMNSMDMSYLYDTLYDGGLSTASTLVFGFGINESGPTGSNYVDVTSVDMTFNRASDTAEVFSLGSDTVRVYNYEQGTNTAEALFAVDLGFDFMQEYSSASTEQFVISSSINDTNDGAEIYFLSPEYTAALVPEPVSTTLFLVGGATLGLRRLRKRSAA